MISFFDFDGVSTQLMSVTLYLKMYTLGMQTFHMMKKSIKSCFICIEGWLDRPMSI